MNEIMSRYVFSTLVGIFLYTNANAAVVYDNFGPGMSFDTSAGQGVGSLAYGEYGLLFTPSASGLLSNLTVAASSNSGTAEITFTLYDNNFGAPGAVLETLFLTNLPDFGTSFTPQIIAAAGTTYLEASQSYWLIASHPNSPYISTWHNSTIDADTLIAFRDSTYTEWWPQYHEKQWALRVEVSDTNVTIDIKPGKDNENIINVKKDRSLKVAIIHDTGFDATQVDPATVTFGPANASPTKYQVRDVDRDGDADMLLTFKVNDTGIVCGTMSATLSGFTGSGDGIVGSDTVTVEPCP